MLHAGQTCGNNITVDGELEFDSIASKKWVFAWKERLKCTKCDFVGQYHTLYYEEKQHLSTS
jgi:hypothetical protein